MLGYVSKDVYDDEVKRRVAAEATATVLREQLQVAQDHARDLLTQYTQQAKDLLDHIAPLAKSSPLAQGEEVLKNMSAEEIMALPASTRREMILRNHQARLARARESQEQDKAARESREAMFSDAERSEINGDFDPMMGVFQPKEVSDNAAN